mmetsp:Transcript_3113/g.4532  ORF Transcript_3113/g.4532 Transcript_3113/m.4532 type:complete len:161 (-) Transcript_3113:106-588(-)
MKTSAAIIICTVASASAFAPAASFRSGTALEAKKSFFETVFDMDLFKDVADQNDYGARSKKNLSVGKIGSGSYVPSGLTAAQYEKVRAEEQSKKQANYAKNVAKAGKFLDYTKFYTDRGTDLKADWKKSVTLGHRMAKTKYDWSGNKDETKLFESFGKKK